MMDEDASLFFFLKDSFPDISKGDRDAAVKHVDGDGDSDGDGDAVGFEEEFDKGYFDNDRALIRGTSNVNDIFSTDFESDHNDIDNDNDDNDEDD